MTSPLASTRTTLLGLAAIVALLVWTMPGLAILVGYSVLLAYGLAPLVDALERIPFPRDRRLPRHVAAAALMLTLVGLVGWVLALVIPRLAAELIHFATTAPATLGRLAENLRLYGVSHGLSSWLDPLIESARTNASNWLGNLGALLPRVVGKLFGSIGELLGLALLPLLAFYLLADSKEVRASVFRFVPVAAQPDLVRMGTSVDHAIRGWVRGQAIVCLVTGAAMAVALSLQNYPAALLLGVLTGVAELIPYLGFMVAFVALALAGLSVDPPTALAGVLTYVVINWTIGTFVTPRVMGRFLKMHPFVVTVSVLAGAQILGPAGALLALPGAAVVQSLISQFTGPVRAVAPDAGTKRA